MKLSWYKYISKWNICMHGYFIIILTCLWILLSKSRYVCNKLSTTSISQKICYFQKKKKLFIHEFNCKSLFYKNMWKWKHYQMQINDSYWQLYHYFCVWRYLLNILLATSQESFSFKSIWKSDTERKLQKLCDFNRPNKIPQP